MAFDLRQPALLKHELGEANRRLAREAETPPSIVGLVEDIADAIAAGDSEEVATVNPWLWIRLQSAALRAQASLREDDPQRRRQLRVALEQMRFLFARIADREPIGEDRPAAEVAGWLDGKLASVSQPKKADLLGVSPRTYQRWISDREAATPSGEDERRLRVVARIVNQLRHSLTGPGVVDWFDHPRADLDGATPTEILDDQDKLELLLAAAAASRGNVAA
jgi:transcriptional regulator with XRE-family HTH domain